MKTWLKGGLIGLLISILIFSPIWIMSTGSTQNQRQFYYERFKLCEPCGMPRDLDCVMEKCIPERTKMYYHDFKASLPSCILNKACPSLEHYLEIECSEKSIDIASGHPEAFIRGFCGYDQFSGFNYGKKPTMIGSFFNFHTLDLAFNFVFQFGVLVFLLLILPIPLGILIGYKVGKRRK